MENEEMLSMAVIMVMFPILRVAAPSFAPWSVVIGLILIIVGLWRYTHRHK